MKNKIKFIIVFAFLFLYPTVSLANNNMVSVEVVNSVKVNDKKVDNIHRKYPFLKYKDVLYIPLTYYDAKYMGLLFHNFNGAFRINTTYDLNMYNDYKQNFANKKMDKAKIANMIISYSYSSDFEEDNKTIEYPILKFRNIYYMPLDARNIKNYNFKVVENKDEYTIDTRESTLYNARFSYDKRKRVVYGDNNLTLVFMEKGGLSGVSYDLYMYKGYYNNNLTYIGDASDIRRIFDEEQNNATKNIYVKDNYLYIKLYKLYEDGSLSRTTDDIYMINLKNNKMIYKIIN